MARPTTRMATGRTSRARRTRRSGSRSRQSRHGTARHGRVLLDEQIVGHHSRLHRITADATVPDIGPRALLSVWPDLSTDVPTVLRAMSADFTGWAVVEHADGRIGSFHADGDDRV